MARLNSTTASCKLTPVQGSPTQRYLTVTFIIVYSPWEAGCWFTETVFIQSGTSTIG